jgi:trimeric autotransporter adhesin
MLGFTAVRANTFCVTDPATLEVAFSIASLINTSTHLIKVQQGTYLMTATIDHDFAAPTTIEGGYTAGCASRVVNPANTVIDIGLGHGFQLRQLAASPQAMINVDGVTFAHANNGLFIQAGQFGDFSNDAGRLQITRTRFTNLAVGNVYPVRLVAFNSAIILENVLIDHISTTETCGFVLRGEGGVTMQLNHVTADLTSGDDICFDDDNDTDTTINVYNSILWSSGANHATFTGNLSSGTEVFFANNVMTSHFITGTLPVIQNQINAAPGWANPAAANYRLSVSPLSVAINSGTAAVSFGTEPSTDIESSVRVIGSAPDRGAYESAVDDHDQIVVTNTLDSGAGSLRQAIISANVSITPPKLITFNIRNGNNVPICPAVITLNSLLPTIVSRVTIDGSTQPLSTKNTDPDAFNANLCVLLKPASGTLGAAFTVPTSSFGSLTLRGMGIGGFGQPVRILGGQGGVVVGNQFGGTANGVALPGAGINAVTIGGDASGALIVGGISAADRNVIGGAATSGIINQSSALIGFTTCQFINNLIGLDRDGHTVLANAFGINNSGSGCEFVGNRIAGNTITNLWLNGPDAHDNIVQRNHIGITNQDLGVDGNATEGILITGANNVIGASGNSGTITANTIRFNNEGGVVIRGAAATGNSVRANLMYDNGFDGFIGERMDIDLQATSANVGPDANDVGDADAGPNQLKNFPVGTSLVYTDSGTGAGMLDRGATVNVTLDSQAGTHRIDAYYSSGPGALGAPQRGRAQVHLGNINVFALFSAPLNFAMPVTIPTQQPGGLVSFTATDSAGNTSEIGTALSIVVPLTDLVFKDGFE